MSTFTTDLQWGNYWEQTSIPLIQKYFEKVFENKKYTCKFIKFNTSTSIACLKKWDLKFGIYNGEGLIKEMTVEVKADKFSSNNLFIEKRCNKIDSGVFATTADFFLYILPRHNTDNFYLVQPYKLKEILMNSWLNAGKYGGDGNRAFGFLIDKDEFKVDYIKGGGKVLTIDLDIPAHFGVAKFNI
ncbi:hypothetical protein NJT12_05030 [Flavobacterium sp. AC]|uniref:Restriction endonuclease n=1 Tax=Flavobacterium azizsancarii TaxID=2961580 RepID=A0ABT4W907_9FLAO|nr:hypothetical protein [Flavobacterium azizsancarii]MDA6068981.1 hypothetical protein [Flavobacterium azizsancarii]